MAGQSRYQLTESLFLRLLGLSYLAAFASLWPQITGLVGSHGIAPVDGVLEGMRGDWGAQAYFDVPTLFWFGISDSALVWVCIFGCVASLLLISGFFARISAAVCWVLYLSLTSVGEPFTGFQWDALLLESGFLALFAGVPWLVWAYRFLVFRLIFESGAVKILSGDPNWRNLHALRFHFMTQPLPNPVAYYMHFAPAWLLDSMTLLTLAIEFGAPFLLFFPRRFRYVGVGLLLLLQLMILLTGNYAFFNLLTIALCLWGLDDSVFAPLARFLKNPVPPVMSRVLRPVLQTLVAVLIAIGSLQVVRQFAPAVARPFSKILNFIGPWEIVNSYGLFAIMTTSRPEIVIEGSDDGETWREYSFPYKPGEVHRGLPLVAPHQPRLDWQMWFAALGNYAQNSWIAGLMERILQGEPSVMHLMGPPPFDRPPHYLRALLYSYRFTSPAERSRTGAVWERQFIRVWFGPVALNQQTNSD
jgi:hypothetical protein